MMFCSSFSQLYSDYNAFFIMLCGLHLTRVTAIFNLDSTAGAKFNWVFFEPFAFLAIIYFDHTGVLSRSGAIYAYIGFFIATIIRYFLLMGNIVNQITSHMGLHFLKVKSKAKVQ